MFLQIPVPGTWLELEKDWSFTLFEEHRNKSLWDAIPNKEGNIREIVHAPVTIDLSWGSLTTQRKDRVMDISLPKGSQLRVDRVYIRKGSNSEFDSLTFVLDINTVKGDYFKFPANKRTQARFWARLGDINAKMDVKMIDR